VSSHTNTVAFEMTGGGVRSPENGKTALAELASAKTEPANSAEA